jgi:hypothetical protein
MINSRIARMPSGADLVSLTDAGKKPLTFHDDRLEL